MEGQKKQDTYKSFNGKTEAEVKAFFQGKSIHCVKCKKDFDGNEKFAYTIKNSLSINLRSDSSLNHGVPALVCSCGYENTVLKLLSQV